MLLPSEVQQEFLKHEDENYSFRLYLKGHADSDELDEQFLELHEELFQDYDCNSCRNCCKLSTALFEPDEIRPAAQHLEISKKEFIESYLIQEDGDYIVNSSPCSFLCENGRCNLGEDKPDGCAGFPFTNQPERLFHLHSFLVASSICPVAYEILERLKGAYNFRWGEKKVTME